MSQKAQARTSKSTNPKKDGKAGKKVTEEAAEPAQSIGAWTREQIEAIVVAVILALLIRHFAVEAFKIPTGSMQPTLHGSERGGDRILVYKPSYNVSKPERWDIIVFKYPLNSSVNYIKRLVGLPGEELRIKDGDIYINGEIAQKPRNVQEHLWKNWPVYPRPGADDPVEQFFRQEPEGVFQRDGKDIVVESAEEAVLRYPTPILLGATARTRDASIRGGLVGETAIVGDVLLQYRARPETEDTVLLAEIRESDNIFRLEMPAGEAPRILHSTIDTTSGRPVVSAGTEIGRARDDDATKVGERYRIDFYYIDGAICLDIDGSELLRVEHSIEVMRRAQNHVRFGVARGKASFRDVRMYRDLYHTTQGPSTYVTIPEDKYFVLGDNTLQSKDSRLWNITEIEHDGRTIYFDEDDRAARKIGNTIMFPDIYGQPYEISGYRQKKSLRKPSPFVPEEYILGKAFSTFWPPMREGKRNLKFVH